MNNPSAIRPAQEPGTDGERVRRWASRFILPPDLMAKARRRLGILALMFGWLPLIFYPVIILSFAGFDWVSTAAVASTVVIAFALYFATRSRRFGDAAVIYLGLAFEVLLCLSASTFAEWDSYLQTGGGETLTFAAVIIVAFPLIVPATPWLTLVSSVIAASMAPLGLYIMYGLGVVGAPVPVELIRVSVAPAVCVVLAYLGSRVIHDIGTELVRARELGSYTLEALLGRGGMGEVWRARHRMLSRPAAIKLIKPEALDVDRDAARSLLKRFDLEAQTTARLRSPHTVQLYDFGISPEGTFYYVMELLEGVDLQAFVEQHGAMPARRAVFLLQQVCRSLHEAHRIGLVHRDIKPSNIFLCRYGAEVDFIKVLDFGLVKHSDLPGTDLEMNLTERGNVVGTPAFIAPEMVMSGTDIDARADIYSLGCVAYWLLTASQVFPSNNPMEAAVHHVKDLPEPPSSRAELDIPEVLDALVLSCLEKDPEKRPQSAGMLSERLRAIPIDPPWTEADARRWWDRTYPETVA